jgi:hypothetical protein
MRKSVPAILCLGAFVAWLAWPGPSGNATAEGEQAIANFGFGLRIAGSYLVEFEQQPPIPRPPVPALLTLSADGGMTVTDVQTLFGDGDPAFVGFRSPIHGTWRMAGNGEVVFRMVGFGYDEDGNLGAPALGGGSILRTTGRIYFSEDILTGDADVDIFAPGQDPLDPGEAPAFTIVIAIEGRLIDV